MKPKFNHEILKALGLLTETSECKETYSNEPKGAPDLDRLANSKSDFFKEINVEHNETYAKIILTDWSLFFLTLLDLKSYWEVLTACMNGGCEIYAWQNGDLVSIRYFEEFEQCALSMQVTTPAEVIAIASQKYNFESDSIVQWDYFTARKAFYQLSQQFTNEVRAIHKYYKNSLDNNKLDDQTKTALIPQQKSLIGNLTTSIDDAFHLSDLVIIDDISLKRIFETTRKHTVKSITINSWSKRALELISVIKSYHPEAELLNINYRGFESEITIKDYINSEWKIHALTVEIITKADIANFDSFLKQLPVMPDLRSFYFSGNHIYFEPLLALIGTNVRYLTLLFIVGDKIAKTDKFTKVEEFCFGWYGTQLDTPMLPTLSIVSTISFVSNTIFANANTLNKLFLMGGAIEVVGVQQKLKLPALKSLYVFAPGTKKINNYKLATICALINASAATLESLHLEMNESYLTNVIANQIQLQIDHLPLLKTFCLYSDQYLLPFVLNQTAKLKYLYVSPPLKNVLPKVKTIKPLYHLQEMHLGYAHQYTVELVQNALPHSDQLNTLRIVLNQKWEWWTKIINEWSSSSLKYLTLEYPDAEKDNTNFFSAFPKLEYIEQIFTATQGYAHEKTHKVMTDLKKGESAQHIMWDIKAATTQINNAYLSSKAGTVHLAENEVNNTYISSDVATLMMIDRDLKQYTNLKKLMINAYIFGVSGFDKLNSVNYLKFSNSQMSVISLAQFLSTFPNLTSVECTHHHVAENENKLPIKIDALTQLTKLHTLKMQYGTTKPVFSFLHSCPNIVNLYWETAHRKPNNFNPDEKMIHTKLQKLIIISQNRYHYFEYIIALIRNSPLLTILYLNLNYSLSPAEIQLLDETIANLPSLITLEIAITGLIKNDLTATLRRFPNTNFHKVGAPKTTTPTTSITLDTKIRTNQKLYTKQVYTYKDADKKLPHPSYYRKDILNDIILSHDKVELIRTEQSPGDFEKCVFPRVDKLETRYNNLNQSNNAYLFTDTLELDSDSMQAYTGLSPLDVILGYECQIPLKFVYNKLTRQYYVGLLPNSGNLTVKLRVLIKSCPAIKDWNLDLAMHNILGNKDYLISRGKFVIENNQCLFRLNGEDAHVFQDLTPEAIFAEIISFCKSFKDEVLTQEEQKLQGIELLNTLLQVRKGVCRHNAIMFMALAKVLGLHKQPGVYFQAPSNDLHVFAEIFMNGQAYTIDLGGGRAELVIKDLPAQEQKNSNNLQYLMPSEIKSEYPDSENDEKMISSYGKRKLDEEKPAENSTPILAYVNALITEINLELPHQRNILLNFKSYCQINIFYKKFAREAKCQVAYIDNISKISTKIAAVDNHGQFYSVDGDIITEIKQLQSGDILFINWSDYKPENVGFNSILDTDERRIEEVLIPEGVIIFNALDINKRLGDDFYNRCYVHSTVPTKLIDSVNSTHQDLTIPDNNKVLPVMLDNGEFWEKDLLGSLSIMNSRAKVKTGALHHAVINKFEAIELINAPTNIRELNVFMDHVLLKKKFNLYGASFNLPNDFQFIKTSIVHQFDKNQYRVIGYNQKTFLNWKFPLNNFTYAQFFQNYKVENNSVQTTSGWLTYYNNNNNILSILVNGSISLPRWIRLLRTAKEANLALTIITKKWQYLPSAMLSEMKSNDMNIEQHSRHSLNDTSNIQKLYQTPISVVTSNDIDLAALLIKRDKTRIVSVCAKTSYSDLWDPICVKPENNNYFAAEYSQCDILYWLDQDEQRTIIIKGHFSAELTARMSTLFAAVPYLWINGEITFIKGRIIFVTDSKHKFGDIANGYSMVISPEKRWQYVLDKHGNTIDKEFFTTKSQLPEYANLSYAKIEAAISAWKLDKNADPLASFHLLSSSKPLFDQALAKWRESRFEVGNVKISRLEDILYRLNFSIMLNIIGPSGTGKSTIIIDDLKPYYESKFKKTLELFIGIDKEVLLAFAKCPHNAFLLVDEANLEALGSLEIFESIFDEAPSLNIDGKFYPLRHHKFLFVGNFMNYAGRIAHEFLLRHGSVYVFDEWPKDYLQNYVIMPILKMAIPNFMHNQYKQLCTTFLKAYDDFKTLNQFSLLTIRNLHDMCLHARLIHNKITNITQLGKWLAFESVKNSLQLADQQQFANLLEFDFAQYQLQVKKFELEAAETFASTNYVITTSRLPLIRLMHDEILIREFKAKAGLFASLGTKGTYISGVSGAGKSAIVVEYLNSLGYQKLKSTSENTPELRARRKYYYHLSATSPDKLLSELNKIFHEGVFILLDEINTLPIEKQINTLLMNRDKYGKKPTQEGFYLFATGNPATYTNRKELSVAEKNRFVCTTLRDYTKYELAEIAMKKGVPPSSAYEIADKHTKQNAKANYTLGTRFFMRRVNKAINSYSNQSENQNRPFKQHRRIT